MNYRPQVWQDDTSDYQEVAPDFRLRPYIQSYWFSMQIRPVHLAELFQIYVQI